jgi:hypothetical protein
VLRERGFSRTGKRETGKKKKKKNENHRRVQCAPRHTERNQLKLIEQRLLVFHLTASARV